jgi:hypothetical protein
MSYKTDIKETATEISLFGKITINKSTGIITVDNFNASQISLGTLADARLSSNVALTSDINKVAIDALGINATQLGGLDSTAFLQNIITSNDPNNGGFLLKENNTNLGFHTDDFTVTDESGIGGAFVKLSNDIVRINDLQIVDISTTVPATSTSTGQKGQIVYSEDYIYVCIATDTWKRVAISVW